MKMRIDLQYELERILGSRNVYFQPPEYIKLKYPCIIYSLANFSNKNANDKKYIKYKKYTLTLVLQEYTDIIADDLVNKILDLQYCFFDRSFISGNMYHYTFDLYI